MKKHCLKLADLGPAGIESILQRAAEYKAQRGSPSHPKPLLGRTVVLLLEKPSTRTRLSFEVGVQEMGGHLIVAGAHELQLGRGEPLADTARMLSLYTHGVVYRTRSHARLETLAAHSDVPVINGLSDRYHPCQLLADLLTMREQFRRPWSELKVAWVGDGNNMAHSWVEAATLLGFALQLACPAGHHPSRQLIAEALQATDAQRVQLSEDVQLAVRAADVVTTDVWTSMGRETETELRRAAFAPYQVNEACMAGAKPSAIFLHCLPAQRDEEVSAAVIDGPQSRVWAEAENRLHVQKALLEHLLGGAAT